jgi:hypothetical protein
LANVNFWYGGSLDQPYQHHTPTSISEGIQALGYKINHLAQNGWKSSEYLACDFAVIYGMRLNGKEIIEQHNKMGVPVLVCDLGYIDRAMKNNGYDGYWQLGLNGLNWLPETADNKRLKWAVPKQNKGGDYVLIAEQTPNDASHGMDIPELNRWTQNKVRQCEELGIDYIVRPHPMNSWSEYHRDTTIEEDIERASYVVVHNSNTGNDALMMGKPVICDRETRYKPTYYDLVDKEISRSPKYPENLEDYLCRLSYAQWTRDEIATGKAMEYVLRQM